MYPWTGKIWSWIQEFVEALYNMARWGGAFFHNLARISGKKTDRIFMKTIFMKILAKIHIWTKIR